MQNLKDSIKILYTLWVYINTYMASCIEVNSQKKFQDSKLRFFPNVTMDTVIIVSMTNQILIFICSCLDEWNNHFNSSNIPEYSVEIEKFRKITKPVFKRINKWSGLKDYRNMVLAHNFRNKGQSILKDEVSSLKIPLSATEILGITQLLNIVVLEMMEKFKDHISIEDYVNMFTQVPKFNTKGEFSMNDFENVFDEVEELKKIYY